MCQKMVREQSFLMLIHPPYNEEIVLVVVGKVDCGLYRECYFHKAQTKKARCCLEPRG